MVNKVKLLLIAPLTVIVSSMSMIVASTLLEVLLKVLDPKKGFFDFKFIYYIFYKYKNYSISETRSVFTIPFLIIGIAARLITMSPVFT